MSRRRLLVASHAAMILLGTIAGRLYWETQRGTVESTVVEVARSPQAAAAEVAYRFGRAEHARTLLIDMHRMRDRDIVGLGDSMMTELRLAVLDREHVGGATGCNSDTSLVGCLARVRSAAQTGMQC
jgi:hypothetical protein